MNYKLNEVSISVKKTDINYKQEIAKKLNIDSNQILDYKIVRKSLDARKKYDIRFKYSFEVDIEQTIASRLLKAKKIIEINNKQVKPIVFGNDKIDGQIVVVGAGPCGLFAAYKLLKLGYKVTLIERGKEIEKRKIDIDILNNTGKLNLDSNVCFGQGGAGTFSDGKLTTRIKDINGKEVLKTFVRCGAKESILYEAKPHLGTDGMQEVIKNLTHEIVSLGGKVIFEARLCDIAIEDDNVKGIVYEKDSTKHELVTNAVVLATGHSAKDIYKMLYSKEVFLEKKPTAIGFRVEHKREYIDDIQHADFKKYLGSAEYSLTAKHNGRGIYSFCMCPGGIVVCSSTDNESLCINGMSYSARDMENSNSALVVNVRPEDACGDSLSVLEYIDNVGRLAYNQGFVAPAQKISDYIKDNVTKSFDSVKPSYKNGTIMKDLNKIMPSFVNESLKVGLKSFDRKMNGFIDNGILTGVETRTSSPVRITRDTDYQSVNIKGLYPAGEGAGYAGGIMSAAVDGIRTAIRIAERFDSK